MSVITKDLGAVTAYAAAVNRGYTGTKEEFETLMASYATVAQQAAESAQAASSSAQGAFQAATSANTAMNNARTAESNAQSAASGAQASAQSAQASATSAQGYAQSAESAKDTAVDAVDGFEAGAQQALDSVNSAGNNWKSLAEAQKLDAEAWAVGTRDGEDVGSSDPAYHNNAKYYAESAGTDATTASDSAQTATQKASDAQASAEAAAESARTLTIDDTLTQSGQAADAKKTGDEITGIKSALSELISRKAIQQSDLVFENENFVVSNGKAYASSLLSPYNCMAINANRIDFKYRRRNVSYSFYVGVAIDGKFVGNRTNAVVSEVKTLYDEANKTYPYASVNTSVADDSYSNDYEDYTATLTGQVFEFKKGSTTILKFTVASGVEIQGIAFLNYRLDYYSTTDNTDFKDGEIVSIPFEEEISKVEIKADHAEIIGLASNHRMVAGVIRNAGSGWEFIINDKHQGDMNCLSVGISESDNRLYVDYSGINVKKVISFIACPDEALANQGYIIGSSVGLARSYIQIFQNAINSVSGEIEIDSSGNTTILGLDGTSLTATWDSTNSRLNITHSAMNNAIGNSPYISITNSRYARYIPRIYSYSGSTMTVEFWDANTNAKVTEPSNKMSVYFTRIGSALVRKEIDPSTLVSESGNIWFMGIFEV